MINLGIVIVGYNQPACVQCLCQSIRLGQSFIPKFYFYLHSQDENVYAAFLAELKHGDSEFFLYGVNRGLARSWNDGILAAFADGADFVLVANDDMEFLSGAIDDMVKTAVEHPQAMATFIGGTTGYLNQDTHSHNFGCFILAPHAWKTIGCFDENFFPSIYEDVDWCRRALSLGLRDVITVTPYGVHHVGSATFLDDPALCAERAISEPLCRLYYQYKWGEDTGFPFGQKVLGFYIDPAVRHEPYPGFNREDLVEHNVLMGFTVLGLKGENLCP